MPDQDRSETPPPPSRALVVVDRPARVSADERPLAGFLTQLIACQRRLPAYRPARNADPGIAASRYRERGRRAALTFDREA